MTPERLQILLSLSSDFVREMRHRLCAGLVPAASDVAAHQNVQSDSGVVVMTGEDLTTMPSRANLTRRGAGSQRNLQRMETI